MTLGDLSSGRWQKTPGPCGSMQTCLWWIMIIIMPVNDNVNDICTIQTCLNMVLPILDLAKFQPKSSDDNAAYLHSSTVTQRGRWGLWRLWCRCFLAAGLMLPGRQSPWSLGIDQHIYCLGHDHQRLDPVLYSIWYVYSNYMDMQTSPLSSVSYQQTCSLFQIVWRAKIW